MYPCMLWASILKSVTILNLSQNQLLSCYLKSVVELSFRCWGVSCEDHTSSPQLSKIQRLFSDAYGSCPCS